MLTPPLVADWSLEQMSIWNVTLSSSSETTDVIHLHKRYGKRTANNY